MSISEMTIDVGGLIKKRLNELYQKDGLKRTQRWLYTQLLEKGIDMSETKLSNSIAGLRDFTPEELKSINKIIGTDLKLNG